MKKEHDLFNSDSFLDLPHSTQCLYFHFFVRKDKNLKVLNPRAIRRVARAAEIDSEILEESGFTGTQFIDKKGDSVVYLTPLENLNI